MIVLGERKSLVSPTDYCHHANRVSMIGSVPLLLPPLDQYPRLHRSLLFLGFPLLHLGGNCP